MNPLDPEAKSDGPPRHRTLPPPEWNRRDGPRSAASLALERREVEKPVSRRMGPRAEQASQRARLHAANAAGDADAERDASAALARALAARGAELDTATKLARRALLLGEDAALRDELSAWFTALGEPALGAATLAPLLALQAGPDAARTLVRIAVLLCRSGDVAAAADALDEASRRDPADATAPELLGGIGGWSPDVVPPARAAKAYLDASARRDAQGDRAAAFEDLLRASESDPTDDAAAEHLSGALASRGRVGAADVVGREHARACGDGARAAHARRMQRASDRGDVASAVGAGLDAGFDVANDAEDVVLFEELLERAGLSELLAARLELVCDALGGVELARRRVQLGRLYAGPLASPERAVEVWMDALAADPSSDDAKAALREHAAALRDQTPLVEAFIRVGLSEAGSAAARAACLRELAVLAEQRLGDPALALWAVERVVALGAEDADLAAAAARLAPRVRLQDETLAAARAALDAASGPARAEPLRRVAGLLRGRPGVSDAYLATLVELAPLAPEERTWQVALERLLARLGRVEELEALLQGNVARARSRVDEERARLALAAIRRRRGDLAGALSEIAPLLAGSGAHATAWCMALVLAARLGDRSAWARALLRIASTLAPTLRAMLTSVGADALLDAGDVDGARAAAEQASHVDPSLARPVATLAAIALAQHDAATPRALERAMGVIVPRAELCRALAEAYERSEDGALAVAWTQRWLALRPGDAAAAHALLRRVSRTGEASRIADALAWLLSQPRPLDEMLVDVGGALDRLARIDPARGSALARRALDVLGPRGEALREVVLRVADNVGEPGLGIAVVERWLAAGAPGGDRAELLLQVAERRRKAGDADGAARALARAVSEGADPALVLAAVDSALPARSSDGELSLLAARAEALAGLPGADVAGTARAWRDLGAALWDLAGDPAGAVEAWQRAAALDPERGVVQLGRDLVAFAGFDQALGHLEALAAHKREPEAAAEVLAVAATLALHAGDNERALGLAMRAIDLDPGRADALATVERSAGAADIDKLEQVYRRIAGAALGCYGERAVHYRAARQLERRGELERALDHAVRAFEAVPAEGVTFVVAVRLAERTGHPAELVRALERVASRSKTADGRAAWLRRAALLSGSSDEGRHQRVDVLLRALAVLPEGATVRALGNAMADLVGLGLEDRDTVEMRFERALESLLPRLEGPEGARIAVEAARAALESFGSSRLALEALTRAVKCDGDIDEFSSLSGHVPELAAGAAAGELVAFVVAQSSDRFAAVGRELSVLVADIAVTLGDELAAARLLVAAALHNADDAELVRRAGRAADQSGDPELIASMLDAIPPAERVGKLLQVASRAEADGDPATAMDALERARESEHITPEDRDAAFRRLVELYGRAGRRDALEALLRGELEKSELSGADRARAVRDLAALLAARGDPERALELLSDLARERGDDELVLGDMVALARQAGDRRREAEALGRLVDMEQNDTARAGLLRDLAPLLESQGDVDHAFERWGQLLAIAPDDVDALSALQREAEKRGDYDKLVALLARRASLASMVEDVRRLRLHRAMVMEQRLGRPDEARAELQALVAATGDNLGVLRVLADLEERLGAPLQAAPLWFRASAIARDRDEAADLGRRSCEAYLAGGDVESARRVIEGMEAWAHSPHLLELAVQVERRDNNPLALAAALEDLALASEESPMARAALLVEAANASEAGGDDAAATARAARAVRIAPLSLTAQLTAHRLEYIQGALESPERARMCVAELRGARGELDPSEAELKAFLVAEALDIAVGGDASLRELKRAEDEIGVLPLIALGLAERLARGGAPADALPLFEIALAGDLRRLRDRGQVALAAAATARRCGQRERALAYLEVAASEPGTRAEALGMQAEIRDRRRDATGPHATPAASTSELPPPPRTSSRPPPFASRYSLSGDVAEDDTAEPPPVRRASSRPPPRRSSRPPPRQSSRPPPSQSVPESEHGRRASATFEAINAVEISLLDALGRGSVEAGRELIRQLENRAERTHDLLGACRRVALLVPGDRWVLEKLHEAAQVDRHHVHAHAVAHVLAAFDRSLDPVPPPPLYDQPEHPEHVLGLLFRDTMTPALEALSIVWEGAEHVFRRDPGTYGVTGLERVPFGAPTPLGRVYSGAARALGLTRAPLFQRRSSPGSITLSVALLSPPALILSGEVRQETPELRFHVGAMLAATLPQHVLLFGAPETQTRAVLKGLALAFGPPKQSERGGLGAAASLAEVLWESIPTRLQRRLRELCDDPAALDYEAALAAGRQSIRRAGLFVAGDLGVAVRETCADDGIPLRTLEEPDGLASLCSSSPAVADLVRVATSSQYAEARWQPARDRNRPPSGSHAIF